MGIILKLEILPNRINNQDWKAVYNDCLKLVEAYPFMDRINDNETYDITWSYVQKTKERKIEECNNNNGVYIIGDMHTMKNAEGFLLVDSLDYYRSLIKFKDDVGEALFSLVSDHYDELEDYDNGIVEVFNAKTQGLDYHKYLLAIACLIESRFPQYAIVSGDISRGQMEDAVSWANTILENPIKTTPRTDNRMLISRIKKVINDPVLALNIFMSTTLSKAGSELGAIIRDNFECEVVSKYNKSFIKRYKIGTIGFSNSIDDYFNLDFELDELCNICFDDYTNIDCKEVEKFIGKILDLGMHLNKDKKRIGREYLARTMDLESKKENSKTPDSVESLFAKVFSVMSYGSFKQSTRFIPLNVIREVFNEKFGEICDTNKIIDEYIKRDSESLEISILEELLGEMSNIEVNDEVKDANDRVEDVNDEVKGANDKLKDANDEFKDLYDLLEELTNKVTYDIESIDQLIFWHQGLTIDPELEKSIKKIREFVDKYMSKDLHKSNSYFKYDKDKRMRYLIELNQYFKITIDTWKYICDNIMDNSMFSKFISILCIKADEKNINSACKNIMNNLELFEAYIRY